MILLRYLFLKLHSQRMIYSFSNDTTEQSRVSANCTCLMFVAWHKGLSSWLNLLALIGSCGDINHCHWCPVNINAGGTLC